MSGPEQFEPSGERPAPDFKREAVPLEDERLAEAAEQPQASGLDRSSGLEKRGLTSSDRQNIELTHPVQEQLQEVVILGLISGSRERLTSQERREHILDGDGEGNGGHRHPGAEGKTAFPEGWSDDFIVDTSESLVLDRGLSWRTERGRPGRSRTKAGDPARFSVVGERYGIMIKVVFEPEGEGVITAYPERQEGDNE